MNTELLLHTRTRIAVLTLAFLGSAMTAPAHTQGLSTEYQVVVNGRIVQANGADDLLKFLRRHVTAYRLAVHAASPGDQPLLVLDGVALHGGVQRLEDIRLDHVHGVTVLRPRDAMTRYGAKGHNGAIVITTKSGVTPHDRSR